MEGSPKLRYTDLFKRHRHYNQLIQSTSHRYLHLFLALINPHETILDVGSGGNSIIPQGYQKITIDLVWECKPDVLGSAIAIPAKSESISHICCSWVLEHIEEPAMALGEFYRTLKPGGYLYLTANFVWHVHEAPRDFFRYTEHGLKHLLQNQGPWRIVLFEPTAGFWITMSQMFNYKVAKILKGMHPLVTVPSQVLGIFLEKLDFDKSVAAGYCAIAQKPY